MSKPNRLINEKSPYLLQHAHNPVDWYSWGDEAFEKAKNEDKPIFLSIGYSTCYWCHVMEREVFENEQIASEMNRIFVNIKVDREERPDVDRVYMTALQTMTGSGGWPMSMFLNTELKPFYGGTYIPPGAKYGVGGFEELIHKLEEAWKTRRDEVNQSGEKIISFINELSKNRASETELNNELLLKGASQFRNGFDEDYGGFGSAPKFPRPSGLSFLLRAYKQFDDQESLKMVIRTLLQMARGGVYDQLGGGFHRYSVDNFWRVPHYEKMLYDQAQLAVIYTEAYQITKDKYFAQIAKEILAYVSSCLTSPEGGFYSAEDAESVVDKSEPDVKSEGAYYIWEKEKIDSLLGTDSEVFCYHFGIDGQGNAPAGSDPHGVLTNKNTLYIAHSVSETANKFEIPTDRAVEIIENGKHSLLEERAKRVRPHLDDKILTSWNGLMISAFAKAYAVFGDERYLESAKRSADFNMENLYSWRTRILKHRYRDGEAKYDGTLEDYAFFAQALIDLYESCFEVKMLEAAAAITTFMIDEFYDKSEGGFFDISGKDKSILLRTKEDYDSAEPTGNSVAISNLLRLSHIIERTDWYDMAFNSLHIFSGKLEAQPYAMPQMLCTLLMALNEPKQIVISGDPAKHEVQDLIREVHRHFIPSRVIISSHTDNDLLKPWLIYKSEEPKVYVCENFTCKLPTSDIEELRKLLA